MSNQSGHPSTNQRSYEPHEPNKTTSSPIEDTITSLLSSSANGQTRTVETLLAEGVSPDTHRGDRTTPLMLASQEGHSPTVSLLIRHKADVNFQDNEGTAALHLACCYGHTQVVKQLLISGANVNLARSTQDGTTPLVLACQEGNTDIVELLLENGAQADSEDIDGRFPLLTASKNGHVNVLALLLKHRADVNKQNRHGHTALMGACLGGHKSCVQTLVEHSADCGLKNTQGKTAVGIARDKGHFDIEQILFSNPIKSSLTKIQVLRRAKSLNKQPDKTSITTTFRAMSFGSHKEYKRQPGTPVTLMFPPDVNTVKMAITAADSDVHLCISLDSNPETQYERTNTPPGSIGSLTLDRLADLEKLLWDARPKWENLGVQLKLSYSTIEVIRSQNHHEIDKCFTEMLTRWLKGDGDCCPSLEELVEALESPPVNYPKLAENVRKNLIKAE